MANQLGGLFYWSGVADAATPSRSLLYAGYDVLSRLV